MTIWSTHNDPAIGGFCESNGLPVRELNERRERNEEGKEAPCSSNLEAHRPFAMTSFCDVFSIDKKTTFLAMDECSIGHGNLLCQIVKELVENSIDACRKSIITDFQNNSEEDHKKRIRVDIKPFTDDRSFVNLSKPDYASTEHSNDILQVTVTDNGCGMENIHRCVNAFPSTKAGKRTDEIIKSHVGGRHGIGLTLCLVHAQRYVPNSRAYISSATSKSKFLTRAFFEADEQDYSVMCVEEEATSFSSLEQKSGTCVSLLVPVSSWIALPFS